MPQYGKCTKCCVNKRVIGLHSVAIHASLQGALAAFKMLLIKSINYVCTRICCKGVCFRLFGC